MKELRLRGVAAIDAANAVLRGFVADHNARFAKAPRSPKDLHRPLSARDDVDAALAWREERAVPNSPAPRYDKALFPLEPSGFARGLARRRVTVLDHPDDGRLEVRHRGRALPCTAFGKPRHAPRQAPAVERGSLDAALGAVRARRGEREGRGTTGPAAMVPPAPPATAGDRLEAALAFVRAPQEGRVPWKRSTGAPFGRGQTNHMLGTG